MQVALSKLFETHEGHRLPGSSPLDVRHADRGNVRQKVSPYPTSKVPSAPTPFPTSSARPSRGTNERICVARAPARSFEDARGAPRPGEIYDGDIVFVQRGGLLGRDSHPVVASMRQINVVLASSIRASGPRAPSGATPSLGELSSSVQRPEKRWEDTCAFLGRWTPEGVAFSVDRSEGGRQGPARDDELLEVAIGGTTPLRNASTGRDPQVVDTSAAAGDVVYLGLVAEEKGSVFSYQFRAFTARQLLADAGGASSDFCRMVQTWRLGRLLDLAAGRADGAAKLSTISVDVREVPTHLLAENLDCPRLGASNWGSALPGSALNDVTFLKKLSEISASRVQLSRGRAHLMAYLERADSRWLVPESRALLSALFDAKHSIPSVSGEMAWGTIWSKEEAFRTEFFKCRFVLEAALLLQEYEKANKEKFKSLKALVAPP
jgi:hypothetical protein